MVVHVLEMDGREDDGGDHAEPLEQAGRERQGGAEGDFEGAGEETRVAEGVDEVSRDAAAVCAGEVVVPGSEDH